MLTLKRIAMTEDGTFGVLMVGLVPFALTVERPWLDNRKSVSCIPAGNYYCRRVNSPKFGDTFEVTDVPGRTHILFHKGNLMGDSHGCIIVGEQFEPLKGRQAVLSSKKGFEEFKARTRDRDGFILSIRNHF
jgi:hypothetical protein